MYKSIWYEMRKVFENKFFILFYIAFVFLSVFSVQQPYNHDLATKEVIDKYPGPLSDHADEITKIYLANEDKKKQAQVDFLLNNCPSILDENMNYKDYEQMNKEEQNCYESSWKSQEEYIEIHMIYNSIYYQLDLNPNSIHEDLNINGLLNGQTEHREKLILEALEREKQLDNRNEYYYSPIALSFDSSILSGHIVGLLIMAYFSALLIFSVDKNNRVEELIATTKVGRKNYYVKVLSYLMIVVIIFIFGHIPYLAKLITEYELSYFWNQLYFSRNSRWIWFDLTVGQYLLFRSFIIMLIVLSFGLFGAYFSSLTKSIVSNIIIFVTFMSIKTAILTVVPSTNFFTNLNLIPNAYQHELHYPTMILRMDTYNFLEMDIYSYLKYFELQITSIYIITATILVLGYSLYYNKKANI